MQCSKGALLDHLVGYREHVLRNFEAQRLGGLEIDYQLVRHPSFKGLLHQDGTAAKK